MQWLTLRPECRVPSGVVNRSLLFCDWGIGRRVVMELAIAREWFSFLGFLVILFVGPEYGFLDAMAGAAL